MISATKKREIATMLNEYGRDLEAYAQWLSDWRKRQMQFRCKRRQEKQELE